MAKEGWFPKGEYVVLGLILKPSGSVQAIVEESPDTPGLHPMESLVVTDARLPSSWRIFVDAEGTVDLSPPEWTAEFWSAFENGDAKAWETYRATKARIESES